ncbi:MAG: YcxB family protein [Lachnospiraceae bacterium]|nr:YcxB family protein [Lachnospiraceae bacterium]
MKCEFDVQMTASSLYDYNMYHTYSGTAGIVGTAVGTLFLILFAAYRQPAYLVAGLVIILYSPVVLYMNSVKQIKLNPVYKNPLHYMLDEEGVTVTAGDESLKVEWDKMIKARATNQSILLYTGPKSAWVFPKKDLGQKRYDVIEMISTHMSSEKVKIRQ